MDRLSRPGADAGSLQARAARGDAGLERDAEGRAGNPFGNALLKDLDESNGFLGATRAEFAKKDAAATALDIYPQLDPKHRPAFMEALGLMARSFPKDQQVTFWNNVEKTGGRAVDDLVRDIDSVPRRWR